MKTRFTSNPYIKASWHEVNVRLTKLTNDYLNDKNDSSDLLKKAEEVLYKLGWTLEEYQTKNRPKTKRGCSSVGRARE